MDDVVRAGQSVLLDVNDGDRFLFARINSSATVKLGNAKYSLQALIGSPYGAAFEVQKGPSGDDVLVRCSIESEEDLGDVVGEEVESIYMTRDNRNLIDNNTAQSLSAEDIDELRRGCSSGRDIVNALIANSVSYDSKTAFSQEKYRRKKQRKYAPRLRVRRPTARSVCEAYFAKSPLKIGCLRIDTLSILLSLANVGANANILVLDTVGGMLTAAVAERMNGFGSLCSVYYTSKPPSSEIVSLLNFSSEASSRIFRVPLSKLLELSAAKKKEEVIPGKVEKESLLDQTGTENATASSMKMEPEKKEPVTSMEMEPEKKEPVTSMEMQPEKKEPITSMEMQPEKKEPVTSMETETGSEIDSASKLADKSMPVVDGEVEPPNAGTRDTSRGNKSEKNNSNRMVQAADAEISNWLEDGFSSLVVAAPDINPSSVLQKLLPLLAPSATFALYHPYLQPLSECMSSLQKDRLALALQLSEPWMREYQVLPSRTHPHMQMSATGGYLLSGIRVVEQQIIAQSSVL